MATQREQRRAATLTNIKAVARRQMAEQGAAALSLRAIAAEMGITAPAIYRYFPSRDDLVTALIVDANHDQADAVAAASAAHPADDLFGRFMATTGAYRAWALAHPADYALVLGTPIPGYHAPADITMPSARPGMDVFMDILVAVPGLSSSPAPGASRMAPIPLPAVDGQHDQSVSPNVLHIALAGWGRMHGLVSLELFGHLDFLTDDPGALFREEMLALAARIGLTPATPPILAPDRPQDRGG